jgi:hypothetical protein
MAEATYVVHVTGSEIIAHPFKFFTKCSAAIDHASEQTQEDTGVDRAAVYKLTGITNARAAVAAVGMAEGELICVKSRQQSPEEIEREWERAQKVGIHAALQFLGLS